MVLSTAARRLLAIKIAVFALCLVPLGALLAQAVAGDLGANPVETITRHTGEWALKLLMVTLMVTPLRRLTGWQWPMRVRRMLGLFCYFYACLHFLIYAVLDAELSLGFIAEDVLERPYITAGFTAFMVLAPLALTSTNAMQRRLGGKRWRRLHRLVYVAAGAAVLHFLWLVKADLNEPLTYLVALLVLLALRLPPVAARLPAVTRRRPHAA